MSNNTTAIQSKAFIALPERTTLHRTKSSVVGIKTNNLSINLPTIGKKPHKKSTPKIRAIYSIRNESINITDIINVKKYFPSIKGPVWLDQPNERLLSIKKPQGIPKGLYSYVMRKYALSG
jgi:hypothetical protein